MRILVTGDAGFIGSAVNLADGAGGPHHAFRAHREALRRTVARCLDHRDRWQAIRARGLGGERLGPAKPAVGGGAR